MTNILRDLWEDAARGRLYVPRETLESHGIDAREAADVLDHPALPLACADLAARARTCFSASRALLAQCDRRRLRPSIIMMEVYERLLGRLEAAGWERPSATVKISRAHKLWIVVRHGLI